MEDIERLENCLIGLRELFRRHQIFIKHKYKVTTTEMEIIQLVAMNGPQKMKDIGDAFYIKLSTLTSIVDKIEAQKLVKRLNSKVDRRSVFLDVTPRGQNLYKSYRAYIHVSALIMQRIIKPENFSVFVEEFERITTTSSFLKADLKTIATDE